MKEGGWDYIILKGSPPNQHLLRPASARNGPPDTRILGGKGAIPSEEFGSRDPDLSDSDWTESDFQVIFSDPW